MSSLVDTDCAPRPPAFISRSADRLLALFQHPLTLTSALSIGSAPAPGKDCISDIVAPQNYQDKPEIKLEILNHTFHNPGSLCSLPPKTLSKISALTKRKAPARAKVAL